jgi:hypothetical protein
LPPLPFLSTFIIVFALHSFRRHAIADFRHTPFHDAIIFRLSLPLFFFAFEDASRAFACFFAVFAVRFRRHFFISSAADIDILMTFTLMSPIIRPGFSLDVIFSFSSIDFLHLLIFSPFSLFHYFLLSPFLFISSYSLLIR